MMALKDIVFIMSIIVGILIFMSRIKLCSVDLKMKIICGEFSLSTWIYCRVGETEFLS